MLKYIEVVLIVFTSIQFLILIYDFYYMNKTKMETKTKNKKLKQLLILFKNKKKLKPRKIERKLKNKLMQINYLIELNDYLELNTQESQRFHKMILKKYERLFNNITYKYARKDDMKEAYYACFLRQLDIRNEAVYSFLKQGIDSESLYLVENCMQTLYYFGNTKEIVRAVKHLNKKGFYYNKNLLSDGLMKFSGNKIELCAELWKIFPNLTNDYKISLVMFFKLAKFKIEKEMFDVLVNSNKIDDKELNISIIRYFGTITYTKAQKYFLDLLSDTKDFEYDVVIIQSLKKYNSQQIINVLIEKLYSLNYFVRYNSALMLSQKIDLDTIETDDDRVQEMLDYVSNK